MPLTVNPLTGDLVYSPMSQTINVTGGTALLAGQTLVVDALNGDDAHAARGRYDIAYATLGKAITDAHSHDTIQIRPGTYALGAGQAINSGATGLRIYGAGRWLTTILNNDASLHSTADTRSPLISLTGGFNTIEDLTINGNRSIYSATPNYSVDGVWMQGDNNVLRNVRLTNFPGGQGFGISVCEVFLVSLYSGNNNTIDRCLVDDYTGYATLLNITRGEGNKMTNNHVEIGASVPFIQRPTGYGMYADGIVSGNTSNHCSVGFNVDSLLDGHVYSGVTIRGNKFENCHSSGIRATALGDTLQIQDNYISRIEVGDDWPSIYVVATNFEVSRNRIDYVGSGGPVTGLVVAGSTNGIVFDNTQNAGMRSKVADSSWGGANTSVVFRDNLQSDGTPMLQSDGSYIQGNTITATIGTNFVSTSSNGYAVPAGVDLVQSSGTAAVLTLPVIGIAQGQVRPNKTITVQNNFGGNFATVKNASGTTLATVSATSPVVFRAVGSSPDNWKVAYQAQLPMLLVGTSNQINANTTLSLFPGFDFNISNPANAGVAKFRTTSTAASQFGIFSKYSTPAAQQTGDVGAALANYGWVDSGWSYNAAKLSGRVANANLPLGAQVFDTATTPKIAADFATRALYDAAGVRQASWGASVFQVSGTTSGSSASILLGLEATSQVNASDNAIWLYDYNGDPAFYVNGEGTLDLTNNNGSGFFFEVNSSVGIRQAAGLYHNFSLLSGSAGYGFRDDGTGVMQFKNAAGSWTNIGTGGSSASEQTVADATATWGVHTVLRQTVALTATRATTLPAANAFNAGEIITYIDAKTGPTAAFGRTFARAGSDTVNGGTSAVTVCIGGGTARFETDGVSGWTQLDTHTSVVALQDGTDPSKQVNFDLSGITTATTRTIVFPDAAGTMVLASATQTLTNKTLTAPILSTATPASSSATGTAGTIVWDASYIYICTATNTWKRAAIATW